MDVELQLLGLTIAATADDVKKAFRQRALQLHPDRNPNGTEMFKRVNAAYEALLGKLRGADASQTLGDVLPSRSTAARTSSTTSSSWHSSSPTPRWNTDTPLTDEDLFGDMSGGDFGARYHHASCKQGSFSSSSSFRKRYTEARDAAASSEDAPQQGPSSSTQRRQERAYEPSPAMEASARRFMEREAARSQTQSSGGGNSNPTPSSHRPTKPTAEPLRSRIQLEEEWRATREAMRRAEEDAKTLAHESAERRRAELERETQDEWRRMQREMEESRVRDEARQAAAEAGVRAEDERRANAQLRDVQTRRRELRREAFGLLIPDAAALRTLSEMELDLLATTLSNGLALVTAEWNKRQLTPCTVCGAQRRVAATQHAFMCHHTTTCQSCADGAKATGCPICGAGHRQAHNSSD